MSTEHQQHWDFPTLAYLWDAGTRAIVASGEKLDELSDADFDASVRELTDRVLTMVRSLDDGWLAATAFFMVDDIYKSYFYGFDWSRGAIAYLKATAPSVVQELERRGFVVHYVVDGTEGGANLNLMVATLPILFTAAGLAAVGPQAVAVQIMRKAEEHPSNDVEAIRPYIPEGHRLADEIVTGWHAERRSSVYLNLDFNDDSPGLSLDAALAPRGQQGTIVVFRTEAPTLDSRARIYLPPDVTLPPEIMGAAE